MPKCIIENLKKGFVESNSAPWAALVLLLPKSNGGLLFNVDYRKLKIISKKIPISTPLDKGNIVSNTKSQIIYKN